MKKAVIFLEHGFEEIEALGTADLLRRAGIDARLAGVSATLCRGSHKILVEADMRADEIKPDDYDAFVCPGGPAAQNMRSNAYVRDLVKDAYKSGRLIAAICAGPIVLEAAGIMAGKKYTIFPSLKDVIVEGKYVDESLVSDGNIITASGPAFFAEFSFAIINRLSGEEIASRVAVDTLYEK